MALQSGNPFQEPTNNLAETEIFRRIHGMFKNWFTFGTKQDYASAIPSLLELDPQNILDFVPIHRVDSGNGGNTVTLTNNNENDIIVSTSFTASANADFSVEFTNEDGDNLFGPVYGSANSTINIDSAGTIVPNLKNKDLEMVVSTSGDYSLMVRGARLTLQSTATPSIEAGS